MALKPDGVGTGSGTNQGGVKMADHVRVRKLVILQNEKVFVRACRKDGRNRYDPQLQDLYMLEGQQALSEAAQRHYHGFVRR